MENGATVVLESSLALNGWTSTRQRSSPVWNSVGADMEDGRINGVRGTAVYGKPQPDAGSVAFF